MVRKEVKLPEVESTVFTVPEGPLLRKAWVIDPPELRLPDDVLREVTKLKLEGLAEVAALESQIKAVEAKVFTQIAERIV